MGDDSNGLDLMLNEFFTAANDEKLRDKVRKFFSRSDTIVVLGATGVGKTNLLTSLATPMVTGSISRDNRTEAINPRQYRIYGKPFRVIDTPGQELHKTLLNSEVRRLAATPPVRVINVVSFGYHEHKEPSIDEVIDSDNSPRWRYLEEHRLKELSALADWLTWLGDRGTTQWIYTVVSKADLWYGQRPEVLRHYERGAYADMIRKADSKLHHVVAPYCSVVHRFYGAGKVSAEFDDDARLEINGQFWNSLASLVDGGE